MSFTGFAEVRGYGAMKERESFHILNTLDTFPAHPEVLEYATLDVIKPLAPRMLVKGKAGAVLLTSTPCIEAPSTPMRIVLQGTDDVATLTIPCETTLAGAGVKLAGGANAVMGLADILVLMYSPEQSLWLAWGAKSANA